MSDCVAKTKSCNIDFQDAMFKTHLPTWIEQQIGSNDNIWLHVDSVFCRHLLPQQLAAYDSLELISLLLQDTAVTMILTPRFDRNRCKYAIQIQIRAAVGHSAHIPISQS